MLDADKLQLIAEDMIEQGQAALSFRLGRGIASRRKKSVFALYVCVLPYFGSFSFFRRVFLFQ